jgi:L-lactate dehydrogenase complex protein LldG
MGSGVAAAPVSLWTHFTAKAELVGAAVMRAASDAAAAGVLREAAAEYVCTQSVAERFPCVAEGAVRATGEASAEVVAAARFAVAETGSVALDEARLDRGACFLAERLWVLVPEEAIVASLDVGLERLHELVRGGAHHPLLMTGPSRTADIERTLTIGVHGPRALVVLVVGAA